MDAFRAGINQEFTKGKHGSADDFTQLLLISEKLSSLPWVNLLMRVPHFRVRREKPPPPQKPQGLAQRAMTWSKCSQPGPSKRSPLPEREPSTTREQTNGSSTDVAEVSTVSSAPSTSRFVYV